MAKLRKENKESFFARHIYWRSHGSLKSESAKITDNSIIYINLRLHTRKRLTVSETKNIIISQTTLPQFYQSLTVLALFGNICHKYLFSYAMRSFLIKYILTEGALFEDH